MADKGGLSSTTKAKSDIRPSSEKSPKTVELTTSVPDPAPSVDTEQPDNREFQKSPTDNSLRVFVGNLPYDLTEEQLTEFFESAGEMLSILPVGSFFFFCCFVD